MGGNEIDVLLRADTKDTEKTHYVWINDLAWGIWVPI